MSETKSADAIDLEQIYLALEEGPAAHRLEVGPDFWETVDRRPELAGGARLVATFSFTESWTSWEMHPSGDEVVVLLSGALDVVLEEPGGPRRVALRGGECAVVPQGVWHTADVHAPSRTLHITRGEGTQHRPR